MTGQNELVIKHLIDFANSLRSHYDIEKAECNNAVRRYENSSDHFSKNIPEFNKGEVYGIDKCHRILDKLLDEEIKQLTTEIK